MQVVNLPFVKTFQLSVPFNVDLVTFDLLDPQRLQELL